MLAQMRLWHRILAGYAPPILLFVAAAVFVFAALNRADFYEQKATNTWTQFTDFQRLAFNLVSTQRSARGYLLGGGEASLSQHRKDSAPVDQLSGQLEATLQDVQLRSILRELLSIASNLNQRDERLFAMARAGQLEQAIGEWQTSGASELSQRIDQLLARAQSRAAALLEERQLAAGEAQQQVAVALIVGTSLATLAAVVLALSIARGLSRRLEEAVASIASSAAQISATIEQQERTTVAQSGAVSEVTATAEELSRSAQRVSEQADAASGRANEVLRLANEGSASVGASTERITGVKQQTQEVSEQVRQLGNLSGQIGSITGLVREMANQTNVLAINAAVEAARAAEHGKGFGVVATEIRQLAADSKASVERIRSLVVEIQKATTTTVGSVEEETSLILENLDLTRRMGEAFSHVASAMDSAFENAQEIALNVKQQALALRQMGEAMLSIDASAKETAAGAGQIKEGVRRLHQVASELRRMV